MLRRVAAVAAFVLLGGCGGSDTVLDGRLRIPDAEGVVEEISLETLVIGGRDLPIGEKVESFTTRGHEPKALLAWKGSYVHVGVEDGMVRWIAGVGTVVKAKPPYTLYTGVFERVDGDSKRAVFEDGTALKMKPGLEPPAPGEVLVTIDPAKRTIIAFDDA